jgi:predicted AlkP superfamily phosphohydrolase/phosphomutase
MKHIVIGIDGGTEKILRHFEMPFTQKLLDQSGSETLHEDVWSRGWAEMYTGLHARDTKAFYQLPYLDGTHRFHRKYNWKDSMENPEVKPLWDLLDERGVKTLFMNIPTTFPTPQLKNGIFVAGAGGGLNDLSKILDGMCSSEEVRNRLEELNYIVDLRYQTSGITELELLFKGLDDMMLKRAECFVALAKEYHSEFGFLAFRATTIVQYVAYSEIEILMGESEMSELDLQGTKDDRPIHKLLREHYRKLDQALELVFTELAPENFILTADHATVPFLKRANMNPLLSKLGFQQTAKTGQSLKQLVGRFIPGKWMAKIALKTPKSIREATRGFNVGQAKAFSCHDVHGVYVNDSRRFNGPVQEGAELDALVEELCEKLNSDQEFKDHQMTASKYRSRYKDAHFADLLPDVWIERPEEIFFDGIGSKFVEPNPNYAPITGLHEVPRDVNSGQKGKHPIFVFNRELAEQIAADPRNDLTKVYSTTDRIFSNASEGQ